MKRIILAAKAILIATAILAPAQSASASDYTDIQSDRANHFGIDYPDLDFDNGKNASSSHTADFTGTRHHRFGRQTGIGSSYAQTEATTTEAMGGFNYTPTSASPALPSRLATPALQKLDLSPIAGRGLDTGSGAQYGTIDFRTDFVVPGLGSFDKGASSPFSSITSDSLKTNNRNKTRNTSVFSTDLLDPGVRP